MTISLMPIVRLKQPEIRKKCFVDVFAPDMTSEELVDLSYDMDLVSSCVKTMWEYGLDLRYIHEEASVFVPSGWVMNIKSINTFGALTQIIIDFDRFSTDD